MDENERWKLILKKKIKFLVQVLSTMCVYYLITNSKLCATHNYRL